MDLSKYYNRLSPLYPGDIEYFVIHHSATPDLSLTIEDMHRIHLGKGYTCVGYHVVILPDGTRQYGRPIDIMGAQAYGYNDRSLGACLIGYFHEPHSQKPTDKQINSLINQFRDWKRKLGDKEIVGHRTLCATDCPGALFTESMIEKIRDQVRVSSPSGGAGQEKEDYPYQKIIEKYSKPYGFDPLFIAAVIEQESSFNPAAVSSSNAKGLMQLLPGTFEDCRKALGLPVDADIFNPEVNIQAGCYYLGWLEDYLGAKSYPKEKLLSCAYNQGPNQPGMKYAAEVLERYKKRVK